jgi:hypothetical protein
MLLPPGALGYLDRFIFLAGRYFSVSNLASVFDGAGHGVASPRSALH